MRLDVNLFPLIVAIVALLGLGLPVCTLSLARKWAETQRELAGAILACTTVICVLGVIWAAVLVLALIGWLPPLIELM